MTRVLALACLLAVGAHGADVPAMSLAFYRTEIVLFTRDASVDGTVTEQIVAAAAPHLSSPLAAFVAVPRESAYLLNESDDLEPFRGAPATTELEPATPPTASITPPPAPTAAERARDKLAALEANWLDASLEWLPAAQLTLTREKQRIAGAPGLRVVWHGAWIQPVPDRERDSPLPLLLQAGDRIGNHYQVEGRVDVTRGRFLHLDIELWMHDAATDSYVSMAETRRLRSGELNYLDHPRLGMLVRIDPLELPADLSAELAALAKANQ
jgi:hypothetical protein